MELIDWLLIGFFAFVLLLIILRFFYETHPRGLARKTPRRRRRPLFRDDCIYDIPEICEVMGYKEMGHGRYQLSLRGSENNYLPLYYKWQIQPDSIFNALAGRSRAGWHAVNASDPSQVNNSSGFAGMQAALEKERADATHYKNKAQQFEDYGEEKVRDMVEQITKMTKSQQKIPPQQPGGM